MTELELLLLASSSPDKTTYGIPKHMAVATGDMNTAWLMSRITFWQVHNIEKHGHNWVIRPFKEWADEWGMTRRTFDGAIEELIKNFGLEKKIKKSSIYQGNTVLHLRFDPKILYSALKPHQESTIAGIENAQNVQSEISESYNPYITEDTTEDTTELIDRETQGVIAVTGKPIGKKPLRSDDINSLQVNTTSKIRGENWLIGTASQLWDKELSAHQIEMLKKSVHAVIGTHIGYFPSPLEYAHDDRYSTLFREWVLNVKNPKKNGNIQKAGMARWVKQHICNYDSPEGFLVWVESVHKVEIVPKSVTVMAESEKYNLVQMDMFVHNKSRPSDEWMISTEFKAFYEANIGKVRTNEEFQKLWINRS